MVRKLLLAASLCLIGLPVLAQPTSINQFPPGFALQDGSHLNLMVNAINQMNGSAGSATPGYFTKNSGTSGPTPSTGTILQVVGANAAAAARIEIDSFGGVPIFTARRANGTKLAPTAILSADQLGSYNFHGAVSATAYYGPAVAVRAYATENWSGTAGGSKLVFSTTPNTTQTLTDAVTIDQNGNLIAAAQLRTTFGTPTIASGACGTTTNGVITSGTNQAGLITIGAASTTTCTVSFSATLSNAPNACIAFPASAGAAATGTTVARVSSVTTAGFVITGSALASTAYYYLCI